jgi:hypothetical protein
MQVPNAQDVNCAPHTPSRLAPPPPPLRATWAIGSILRAPLCTPSGPLARKCRPLARILASHARASMHGTHAPLLPCSQSLGSHPAIRLLKQRPMAPSWLFRNRGSALTGRYLPDANPPIKNARRKATSQPRGSVPSAKGGEP